MLDSKKRRGSPLLCYMRKNAYDGKTAKCSLSETLSGKTHATVATEVTANKFEPYLSNTDPGHMLSPLGTNQNL